MHVSLAETVKGEITFESEQPNQFVVAPDSVAYGLNDVGRFLFHPPAVKGFAEGFAEPADEGAFAHVGHLCEFVQMLRLMIGAQHEQPEIILGPDHVPQEIAQFLRSVEIAHHQKELVLFDDMIARQMQPFGFENRSQPPEKEEHLGDDRQYGRRSLAGSCPSRYPGQYVVVAERDPIVEIEYHHFAVRQSPYRNIFFPGKEYALSVGEFVVCVPTDTNMYASREQEEDAMRAAVRFGQRFAFGQPRPSESCGETVFLGGTGRASGRTVGSMEAAPYGIFCLFHRLYVSV